jgi:hypothetical protein
LKNPLMISALEKFNLSRDKALGAEADFALERIARVFRARSREMVAFVDRIEGGILPNGGAKSRDLVNLVRAKLSSVGYTLGEELDSVERLPGVFIARSDVPFPPYSDLEREAACFAWDWVSDQLRKVHCSSKGGFNVL